MTLTLPTEAIATLEAELRAAEAADTTPSAMAQALLELALSQNNAEVTALVDRLNTEMGRGNFDWICCDWGQGKVERAIKTVCKRNGGKVVHDSECGIPPRRDGGSGGGSGGGGLWEICQMVPCHVKFVGAEADPAQSYCDIADEIEIVEVNILAKPKPKSKA